MSFSITHDTSTIRNMFILHQPPKWLPGTLSSEIHHLDLCFTKSLVSSFIPACTSTEVGRMFPHCMATVSTIEMIVCSLPSLTLTWREGGRVVLLVGTCSQHVQVNVTITIYKGKSMVITIKD